MVQRTQCRHPCNLLMQCWGKCNRKSVQFQSKQMHSTHTVVFVLGQMKEKIRNKIWGCSIYWSDKSLSHSSLRWALEDFIKTGLFTKASHNPAVAPQRTDGANETPRWTMSWWWLVWPISDRQWVKQGCVITQVFSPCLKRQSWISWKAEDSKYS